ncbi:MAG: DegT/DnrJ/EryC1/StrS family aminotransferase [Candidatus Hydrogenedentes bacterium]|nr:DegT/DnrJ/EryC1/StrS family aminotransferase [Candidatus Hydrogenedentota bacterium]
MRSSLQTIIGKYRLEEPVFVARPTMPPFDRFTERVRPLWESRWLTNQGCLHGELEKRLEEYLGVENLSLFCNGTIALLVALQSLRIHNGEVITTPFTFAATPHVLHWNGVTPVFSDIDPQTLNLDPGRIEQHINSNTRAILAVHVYGRPCDVDALQSIADRHGLAVIYDAAHAFGVRYKGKSVLTYGDASVLSFHATKLYTTMEGGALVASSARHKERVDFLKNFGIADEEMVIGPGINGKLNEMQAAFGLLQLETVDIEIENRGEISALYRERLASIPGISLFAQPPETLPNNAYFPVLVDEGKFGLCRDGLHAVLRECNIITRKYFHPLCSHYPCYSALPSSRPENLPVAEDAAARVLCMPIYGTLQLETVDRICAVIEAIHKESGKSQSL